MSVPTIGRIGYSLCGFDVDEWSWSVEVLRPGETVWGTGSDVRAGGCELTRADAVASVDRALAELGINRATAVRLPF